MPLDDDEFEWSDNEFAKDNQLTIIDEARKRILENIENTSKEAVLNLKYNEKTDYQSNLNIITQNMAALVELNDINENLPEEEIQEKIDKIIKMTTELTMTNIDEVLKNSEDEDGNTDETDATGSGNTTEW